MKNRMLIIEFNELCPGLLLPWMEKGMLPNFRLFYENSQAFLTEADVTDSLYLEPWIQWYSMHTGLNYDVHQVFHLTDGPRSGHKDIWHRLIDEGKRVANFSSMNCLAFDSNGSVFLPDPWCVTEQANPPDLKAFHQFISTMVQEYTNKDKKNSLSLYADFIRFCLGHGLTFETARKILKQLFQEKVVNPQSSWKRPPILDRLQFDIFKFYERKARFDFSTFFSNSTAHYQHAYWRHMDPNAFIVKPSSEDLQRYKNAILFGYQEMDRLLGEFFKLEEEGILLVLATALSQQPYLKKEAQGGQLFYRPRNVENFLKMLGLSYEKVLPVMTHQYLVHFKNQELTEKAFKILKSLKYEKRDVFDFSPTDQCTLYFGIHVQWELPKNAMIEFENGSSKPLKFFDVFYKIPEAMKSGCHHPDGVLWFKTGRPKVYSEKVSILDVFPTILDYFNVPLNEDDRKNLPGRNLSFVFENVIQN